MRSYVINLARKPDRRQAFLRWNSDKGVTFEFSDAVDGCPAPRSELVARGVLAPDNEGYPDGAIGNALSHRQLWEKCAAAGEPVCIFEDDAALHDCFCDAAARAAEALGDGAADIVFFGYNMDATVLVDFGAGAWGRVQFDRRAQSFETFFAEYSHSPEAAYALMLDARQAWGTIAYAISPAGAKTLLASCFPLRSDIKVPGTRPRGPDDSPALDAAINAAIQDGAARAKCYVPPIAVGPNDTAASDVTFTSKTVTLSGYNRKVTVKVPDDPGVNFVLQEIFSRRCYENPLQRKPAEFILDIGANVGLAAVYFRLAYPAARILCVEPDPLAWRFLSANMRAIGNAGAFNIALGEHAARLRLRRGNSMVQNSFFFAEGDRNWSGGEVEVAVERAADFLDEHGIPHFDIIKIDTEGMELPIMTSALRHFQAASTIFIEFHSSADRIRIDGMLGDSHVLYRANIESPNRGILTYVNRGRLAEIPHDASLGPGAAVPS